MVRLPPRLSLFKSDCLKYYRKSPSVSRISFYLCVQASNDPLKYFYINNFVAEVNLSGGVTFFIIQFQFDLREKHEFLKEAIKLSR